MIFTPGGPSVPVRWFFVPPDTPYLNRVSAFTSANWEPNTQDLPRPVGDADKSQHTWTIGLTVTPFNAGCDIGENDAWLKGLAAIPSGPTPPVPECCGVPGGFRLVFSARTATRLSGPGRTRPASNVWGNAGDEVPCWTLAGDGDNALSLVPFSQSGLTGQTGCVLCAVSALIPAGTYRPVGTLAYALALGLLQTAVPNATTTIQYTVALVDAGGNVVTPLLGLTTLVTDPAMAGSWTTQTGWMPLANPFNSLTFDGTTALLVEIGVGVASSSGGLATWQGFLGAGGAPGDLSQTGQVVANPFGVVQDTPGYVIPQTVYAHFDDTGTCPAFDGQTFPLAFSAGEWRSAYLTESLFPPETYLTFNVRGPWWECFLELVSDTAGYLGGDPFGTAAAIPFVATFDNFVALAGAPCAGLTLRATVDTNAEENLVAITGEVIAFAGTAIPAGFLACDGAQHLTASYPALSSVLGSTWGAAPPGFFVVPDLRGSSPLGTSPGGLSPARPTAWAVGNTGGEETHSLVILEIPAHAHGVTDPGHYHYTPGGEDFVVGGGGPGKTAVAGIALVTGIPNTSTNPTGVTVDTIGGDGPHNTLHPFAVVQWLIKT